MDDKPNVLVAGFSRCASTYLYNLLRQHSKIHIPEEKEIGHLHKKPLLLSHPDLPNVKYYLPRKIYHRKFKSKKPIKVDFSVMTAYDLTSAKRIRKQYGDIKIIFLTRNKKKHMESVKKTLKNHGELLAFDTEQFSQFEKFIGPYKKNFSHVLEMKMEDLTKQTERSLSKIFNFLEIEKENINLAVYQNSSKTYHKDKHGSRSKFLIFRIKRNILKIISHLIKTLKF